MWSPSFPVQSELPESQRTNERVELRYEDVCQDGRLLTIGMPHAISAVWSCTVSKMPIATLQKQGVVPILSNLWMEGSDARINVLRGLRLEGGARLGHTVDEKGEVNRILMDLFGTLYGRSGSVHSIHKREGDGEEVRAGSVFARHVFTRPFAPRDQRKVLRFEAEGVAPLPAQQLEWRGGPDFEGIEGMSESEDLESSLVFGMHHTDSNQHVNSLVYPRLFEDAAQLLFARAELGHQRTARKAAISFRKPFFAGQRARIRQRLLRGGDEVGVCGGFYSADAPDGRPHTLIKMFMG